MSKIQEIKKLILEEVDREKDKYDKQELLIVGIFMLVFDEVGEFFNNARRAADALESLARTQEERLKRRYPE